MKLFQTVCRNQGYIQYTFSIVVWENEIMLGTKLAPGYSEPRGWSAVYRGTTVDPREESLIYSDN